MVPDTLGVIGLGAVGGSVAWQAARLGVKRIVGYDASTRDGAAAVKAGAVTEYTLEAASVVRQADFVILAGSGEHTCAHLTDLAERILERGVWCTDVAAVKKPVVTLAADLGLASLFAGSHPFIGLRDGGFRSANPEFLHGALVYVTPVPGGDRAAAEVRDFWSRTIAANTVALDAAQHDQLLAWTSHLPQSVSSALAAVLGAQGPAGVTYSNGAHEVTRQAACPVDQWAEVLLANRDNVLAALQGLTESIGNLSDVLEQGDRKGVEAWLARGSAWRARFGP